MKNWKLLFAAVCSLSLSAQAKPVFTADALSAAAKVMQKLSAPSNANLINWAIGDYHDFSMEMEGFGALGTGHKEVTKEETSQNAIWYVQDMNAMGQEQKVETLLSRADGKVLRQIVNGEEQSVGGGGEQDIEIIEQSETEITTPAGKFDCMYVKANIKQDGQTQQVELWVNPIDVNLDGMLKVVVQSQFGPLSIILQKFGSAQH